MGAYHGLIGGGRVEPVDFRHLADNDEFVAVGPNRAVIVEAVGLLCVAADHVRRLGHDPGHRVVDAAALAGLLGARHVHDLLLRMVHHAHALLDALGDHRTRDQRAVGVVGLDPVVVDDPGGFLASISLIQTIGPPRDSVSISRLSV